MPHIANLARGFFRPVLKVLQSLATPLDLHTSRDRFADSRRVSGSRH